MRSAGHLCKRTVDKRTVDKCIVITLILVYICTCHHFDDSVQMYLIHICTNAYLVSVQVNNIIVRQTPDEHLYHMYIHILHIRLRAIIALGQTPDEHLYHIYIHVLDTRLVLLTFLKFENAQLLNW